MAKKVRKNESQQHYFMKCGRIRPDFRISIAVQLILLLLLSFLDPDRDIELINVLFLNPPHRGYISFVNTFVTHRNNDLGPYVP